MKIFWSTLALERVLEIAENKSEKDKKKGELWVDTIFAAVKRIEQFPKSGRKVPELNREDLREVLFESYRIIYKLNKEQIEVLTVRHMRQQFGEENLYE